MPFCPECRDEFQDWVTVCPDCRVPLVAVLEEDEPEELEESRDYLYSNEPLVHVATAPNEAIAGMWAGILENNGIRCLIKGGDFKWSRYAFLHKPFRRIYVIQSASETARTLLLPFQ
jgi:hypothetical protein